MFFCVLGPLVFTDKNGKTTLHGVVHAGGNKGPECLSTALFVRVADPSILKWIKNKMDINRWYGKLIQLYKLIQCQGRSNHIGNDQNGSKIRCI